MHCVFDLFKCLSPEILDAPVFWSDANTRFVDSIDPIFEEQASSDAAAFGI